MNIRSSRRVALGVFVLAGAFVFVPHSCHAQTLAADPLRAVRNGAFFDEVSGWELVDGRARSSIKSVPIAATDAGGIGRALQIAAKPRAGDNAWSVQVRQSVGVAVAQGETLRLSFWARSPQNAKISAMVEDAATYDKVLIASPQLSPEWKRFEIIGVAAKEFKPNGTTVNFHVGNADAVIELADVRLEDPQHPLPQRLQIAPTQRGSLGKPLSLLSSDDFSNDWQAVRLTATPIENMTPALKRGARLSVPEKQANIWEAKFANVNPRPLVGGDLVAMRVWARSESKNEVAFCFQKADAPYDKLLYQRARLTPEWKEYRFVTVLDGSAGFGARETNFEVQAGAGAGTIELANLRVESFGPSSRPDVLKIVGPETYDFYNGQENSRAWLAPALARIEKLRKAPLRVRVVNAKGQPVIGAKISATMTRHAFRWGTAAPASLMADHADLEALKFQSVLKRLFNTVTFENDLKWHDVAANEQHDIDGAFAWLKDNDIQVRGHNLVWGSTQFFPKTVNGKPTSGMSPDELRTIISERAASQTALYRGRVYLWDVVNEAVAEHDIWDKTGWDAFVNTFKQARQADPNVLLCYNDYMASNRFGDTAGFSREREIVKMLIDANAPLDIVGEQAHLGPTLIPMTRMLKNFDEIAALGKPIEITEFDVGLPDDAANGAYVRDFLTAAFSHPKIDGVIQWGFWQGAHWRAKEGAGLFARDWTPLAAASAYEDLVLKQWWTRAQGATSPDGSYSTRGFLGDYHVSVSKGGKTQMATYKLSKSSPVLTIMLK